MGEQEQFWLRALNFVLDNPLVLLALAAAVVLLVVAAIAAYVYFVWILPGQVGRAVTTKLYEATNAADAQGRRVELTAGAKFMKQRDIAPLASRGMAQAAEDSVGSKVMRPTWGMRLSTVLMAAAGVAVLFFADMGLDPEWMVFIKPAAVGVALLGIAHVFSFEMRYDRDVIISQSLIQFRREIAWRDLVDIRDEGNGVYRLTSADGKKMRVQKYMTGMSDFLTRAHGAIDGRGALA
ncbi:hypothetical protein FHY55_18750 [Oceanicola sp. D3]|uniref:hypothetical protein n=1 Tax=Oceanicola sp. D3 TaxID=2587163 RepID=UPI00111F40BF|nr:hypothetical protein [Oceanicola sp. D3]QDC11147.1 hypothetical protein FHY55_18750 [Oceanicola sp. D3]